MKKQFNVRRKLWHLLGLVIPLLLFLDIFRFLDPGNPHITRWTGMWIIFFLFLFILSVEIFRMYSPSFNSFFIRYFGFLMKEKEKNQFHGTVSYIFSSFLLFAFFTKEVILLSSLILMISDPVAAYVGIHYGKRRFFKRKTWEGTLAFFLSSVAVSLLLLWILTLSGSGNEVFWLKGENAVKLTLIVLAVSSVCALVETFSFTSLKGFIDDNLTIPLSAAISFSTGMYISGYPVPTFFSPLLF